MSHRIQVLHFGGQCPWHQWVIEQGRQAARELGAEFLVRDVTHHPELAEKHRMFFPFMTVIDDCQRIPSPVLAAELVAMVEQPSNQEPAPAMPYGTTVGEAAIKALTPATVPATIPLCIRGVQPIAARQKVRWAQQMMARYRDSLLGFLACQGQEARGAVEFLPANLVPYPLPQKDPSIAFITCIYPTQRDVDHKSPVLAKLIQYLWEAGYARLQVVAGRWTHYPNGPASFFRQHGFFERGELDRITLTEGTEELLLMELDLQCRQRR